MACHGMPGMFPYTLIYVCIISTFFSYILTVTISLSLSLSSSCIIHASFMHLISAFMLCYIQHSSFVVLENRILLLLLVTEVLLSTDFNASSVVDKIESIVFVAVDVVTVDDDTCGS